MNVYDDIDSLYRDLENDAKDYMNELAEDIKRDLDMLIEQNIYNAYEPSSYERTDELKNSVLVKPARKYNGEWNIEVYISNAKHSENGFYPEEKRLDEIIEFFEDGDASWRDNQNVETFSIAKDIWLSGSACKAFRQLLNKLKRKSTIL